MAIPLPACRLCGSDQFPVYVLDKINQMGPRSAALCALAAPGPAPPPSPAPRSDQSDGFTPARPAPTRPADRRPPGNPVPHCAAPQPSRPRPAPGRGAKGAPGLREPRQEPGGTWGKARAMGSAAVARIQSVASLTGGFPVSTVSSRCTGQDQQVST